MNFINKEAIWKAMINFGILKKYVDIINLYNTRIVFNVKYLGELSSDFEVNSGLRQGDS